MKATLDGQIVFEDAELKVQAKSWRRDSIERTIAGLNGVLSIDLGLRSRKINQTGTLRAVNKSALSEKISEINAYMDGGSYTLAIVGGEQFENLRLDCFEVGEKQFSGGDVCCKYEITYTQLRSQVWDL